MQDEDLVWKELQKFVGQSDIYSMLFGVVASYMKQRMLGFECNISSMLREPSSRKMVFEPLFLNLKGFFCLR